MKKIYKLMVTLLGILLSISVILPLGVYAKNDKIFNVDSNPVKVLETFHEKANNNSSDRVQHTDLDYVDSRHCNELGVNGTFSITRTLCNIKANIGDYLQYVMYVGLSAATILLIWNGFKLVTSSDREGQMKNFKKNLINIIIGVVLLVAFYYIIDVFVSVVNLVAE